MCGIAGIATSRDKAPEELATIVRRMTSTLKHRGPEAEGYYVQPPIALGHRRLRIIDLVTGDQPMTSRCGRFVISFNGEIYNFRELRADLCGRGHQFQTTSDTEVLLELLAAKGWEGIRACLGMFAIALWDKLEERLTLVRDRLGVKPLWYTAATDGALYFGSEVKAILEAPRIARQLDRQGLVDYLLYRQPGRSGSLFEGIQQVPPGTGLSWQAGRTRLEKYWELDPTVCRVGLSSNDAVGLVRSEVEGAVRRRLIADVPLGAYLSGGLDSSIVVAVMAAHSSVPVKTFSIGFPEEGFSEFEYARQVASRYGTEHHEIEVNLAGYRDLWRDMIRFRDAPLSVPNEVALYRMSLELKRFITVVLSGEGADELFGGYGRIFRSADDYTRIKALRELPGLFSPALLNELTRPLRSRYGRLDFESANEFFLHRYQWFKPDDVTSLLRQPVPGISRMTQELNSSFGNVASLDPATQFLYVFQQWHLHGLLMRLDATTMASAVEARVPFVDHTLVEAIFALPFDFKCRFRSPAHAIAGQFQVADDVSEALDITKWILRKAFERDLPEAVVQRRKVGFPVPLAGWLKSGLADQAREWIFRAAVRRLELFDERAVERLLSTASTQDEALRVWMLCNIALFVDEYFG